MKEFYRLALDDKKRLLSLTIVKVSFYLVAEDYSYKDISAILGIPIGNSYETLSRAFE